MLETPKPDDVRLTRSRALVVGSNAVAAQAALRRLEQEGYSCRVHTLGLQGPVEDAAAQIVDLARLELSTAAQRRHGDGGERGRGYRCVILGGETTVKFAAATGAAGRGGRCSHMALLVARALSGVPDW